MPRSRGGCINCKKRKRKCDETRPICKACVHRGIQCEGYATPLRWTNGIAVRGRFAGASVPDLGTLAGANNTAKRPDVEVSSPGSSAFSSSDSASQCDLPSSPASDVTSIEQQLFKKFLNSGLRRLYATEASCWLQPFFQQMARQSPALIAVSVAIQAYVDDGTDFPSVSSMERVDLALQTFRKELASRYEAMHPATLCAGLLICTLSLLQAQPWTKYLDLIVDAYQLKTTPGRIPINDEAMCHTLEVMGIMDIPSMVVGRLSPSAGIWKLLRSLQDVQKHGRLSGVEVVSGLPRSLLDIFASILENDDEYTEERLWTWPGEVGEYLQCHLWDCWRFSGILDVRRRRRILQSRRGTMGDTSAVTERPRGAPQTELILCRLMASIDALNRSFELPQNRHLLCHNAMMYPLVAASLEVELLKNNSHWKRTLDEVRAAFLRRDSFRLVKVTFELLDKAWEDETSNFDIEEVAKSRGVELAVF